MNLPKLEEVREYLMANLPLEKAAELYELFLTHANCRRKKSFLKKAGAVEESEP